MFAPLFAAPRVAAPRAKQPVTFLASLGVQGALVALLCLVPPPNGHSCCLRKDDLRAARTTPIYFAPPPIPVATVAKPVPQLAEPASIPEVPSAAKPAATEAQPVEAKLAEPEAKPAEAGTADASAASGGEGTGGIAPFPAWQMSSNHTSHGFHHQVKNALPVFTPEPEILHGQFPEPARGKEVVLKVVINAEGSIVKVTVLQGIGHGVEQSIVETLKRWIYVPAKFNGIAIASQQELRFQFPG